MFLADARVVINSVDIVSRLGVAFVCCVPQFAEVDGRW
jgi:hypothetical protein